MTAFQPIYLLQSDEMPLDISTKNTHVRWSWTYLGLLGLCNNLLLLDRDNITEKNLLIYLVTMKFPFSLCNVIKLGNLNTWILLQVSVHRDSNKFTSWKYSSCTYIQSYRPILLVTMGFLSHNVLGTWIWRRPLENRKCVKKINILNPL